MSGNILLLGVENVGAKSIAHLESFLDNKSEELINVYSMRLVNLSLDSVIK